MIKHIFRILHSCISVEITLISINIIRLFFFLNMVSEVSVLHLLVKYVNDLNTNKQQHIKWLV